MQTLAVSVRTKQAKRGCMSVQAFQRSTSALGLRHIPAAPPRPLGGTAPSLCPGRRAPARPTSGPVWAGGVDGIKVKVKVKCSAALPNSRVTVIPTCPSQHPFRLAGSQPP